VSLAWTWGTGAAERALSYPCDRHLEQIDDSLYRGITIVASPQVIFQWLCQMRVAPYSYDWIDNGGRPSPRALTPGLDDLALGQPVMRIFRLVDFERPRHLTLRLAPGSRASRIFGDLAVTYLIVPQPPDRCRLLVKIAIRRPHGPIGMLMRWVLPWGDLVMMRRQLLTFKALAERASSRLV
jgi:hypothetical protein